MAYIKLFEDFKVDYNGSVKFNDWSEFENKIKTIVETGFTADEEFINNIGFDLSLYNKIKENMIYNWIDSISKSLIHGLENIFDEFPKQGDNIFKNIISQSRFLLVCSNGQSSRDIFGNTNTTNGLGILSRHFDLSNIKSHDSKGGYVKINNELALTILNNKGLDKLNNILQYVWCYVFLQKIKLKEKGKKVPKYLYRGMRSGQLHDLLKDIPEIKTSETNSYKRKVEWYDKILNYINNKNLNILLITKI